MSSDFLELFEDWMVDGCQVQAPAGFGAEGPVLATAVPANQLLVEDKERMVRTSDGQEVLSTRTVYVHRDHPQLSLFVLGSVVTFPGGRRASVLELNDLGAYGIWDHLVVRCE